MERREALCRLLILGNGAAGAEKQALALASRLGRTLKQHHQIETCLHFVPISQTKSKLLWPNHNKKKQ